MRIFHPAIFCLFLSLTISSCGGMDLSVNQENSWIPEVFFYKPLGSCDEGTLRFPVLVSGGTQLWTDPSQVRVGQTELYLQKNGNFTARYREFDFTTQIFEKKIQSKYTLDHNRKEIHLAGLGVATIMKTLRGRSYMHLQYSENYNSPLLAGNTGDLHLYKGRQGVDETAEGYCGW